MSQSLSSQNLKYLATSHLVSSRSPDPDPDPSAPQTFELLYKVLLNHSCSRLCSVPFDDVISANIPCMRPSIDTSTINASSTSQQVSSLPHIDPDDIEMNTTAVNPSLNDIFLSLSIFQKGEIITALCKLPLSSTEI